jgi:hypothetical protein
MKEDMFIPINFTITTSLMENIELKFKIKCSSPFKLLLGGNWNFILKKLVAIHIYLEAICTMVSINNTKIIHTSMYI